MEFRVLGRSDLRVSRIAIGTRAFAERVDEAEAIRIADAGLDLGINFFDTANVYGTGRAESLLGRMLRGRRHRVVLATRVGGVMGNGADESGLSRVAIRKAVEESLRRLQTEYIDLYFLDRPDPGQRIEETLAALEELVREGKIRYPAVAGHASWQVAQMLWHCENHAYTPPSASQCVYNLLARRAEDEHLAFCAEFGIGFVACSPLAGGLLSGKHGRNEPAGADGVLTPDWARGGQVRQPEITLGLRRLEAACKRSAVTLASLACRWVLAQPSVDSLILGVSSLPQLTENLKAVAGPPPDEDLRRECDAVWETLRGVAPLYHL
ncbi:MAG: aldo/keto reductase [Acidobacteria bacterium]|nr:aldo/keto reductase [Acidobacteriota bacterium]